MQKEKQLFEEYTQRKGLKHSAKREIILKVFLKNEGHFTADELYQMVMKEEPGIGYATIYRTLKHLCESGLCSELKSEDGVTRFEHLYGHPHHDHLICTRCGSVKEVVDPRIEELQESLFKRYGFYPERHRMELYGVCGKCRK